VSIANEIEGIGHRTRRVRAEVSSARSRARKPGRSLNHHRRAREASARRVTASRSAKIDPTSGAGSSPKGRRQPCTTASRHSARLPQSSRRAHQVRSTYRSDRHPMDIAPRKFPTNIRKQTSNATDTERFPVAETALCVTAGTTACTRLAVVGAAPRGGAPEFEGRRATRERSAGMAVLNLEEGQRGSRILQKRYENALRRRRTGRRRGKKDRTKSTSVRSPRSRSVHAEGSMFRSTAAKRRGQESPPGRESRRGHHRPESRCTRPSARTRSRVETARGSRRSD